MGLFTPGDPAGSISDHRRSALGKRIAQAFWFSSAYRKDTHPTPSIKSIGRATAVLSEPSRSVMSDSLWPLDCSPPGSSLHGISQARTLEWVATLSSRGSSPPRIKPRSPTLRGSLPSEPAGKPTDAGVGSLSLLQGILLIQESNQGLLHCRQILHQFKK